MFITDMNKMSLEDLDIIHYHMGIGFEINDGKIVGSVYEKSTVTDANLNSASFKK